MKKLFNIIFYGVLALVMGYFLYVKYFAFDIGKKAPDFETTLVDGTPFKLSELQGNYVLLDFWGSWCGPCRKQNPKLVQFYNKNASKITLVTVALERDDTSWKKVVEKDGFNWKYQIVEQSPVVLMSEIARKYGVTAIPTKILISPKGKIIGKLSFEEIEKVLAQSH